MHAYRKQRAHRLSPCQPGRRVCAQDAGVCAYTSMAWAGPAASWVHVCLPRRRGPGLRARTLALAVSRMTTLTSISGVHAWGEVTGSRGSAAVPPVSFGLAHSIIAGTHAQSQRPVTAGMHAHRRQPGWRVGAHQLLHSHMPEDSCTRMPLPTPPPPPGSTS